MSTVNELRTKWASTEEDNERGENKPREAPLGAIALGLTALGLGHGIADADTAESIQESIDTFDPGVFRENPGLRDDVVGGAIPKNHTAMTYYGKHMSPLARLEPFGVTPEKAVVAVRSNRPLLSFLNADESVLSSTKERFGVGGAAHYRAYAAGQVPAYAHDVARKFRNVKVPDELGGGGLSYAAWMGNKFDDFVATSSGQPINPFEVTTEFMDADAQSDLMERFHASLTPEEQAYKIKIEDPGEVGALQAEQYGRAAGSFLKVRDALRGVGFTVGGAGVGGLAGHYLDKLVGDEDTDDLGSRAMRWGGAAAGGAAGFLGGTRAGHSILEKIKDTVEENAAALFKKSNTEEYRSSIPDAIYQRLLAHEGGTQKVTVDTGGTTKGGISAKGTGMTPAQIRALDPKGIRKQWEPYWKQSGAHFNDPRVAEIALNYAGNAGAPTFGKHLQETLNTMNTNAPALKVDGVLGSGTQQRIHTVDQTELGNALLQRFRNHHEGLVKANPAKYGAYQKGWENRRNQMQQLMTQPVPAQKVMPAVPKPAVPTVSSPTAPKIVTPTKQASSLDCLTALRHNTDTPMKDQRTTHCTVSEIEARSMEKSANLALKGMGLAKNLVSKGTAATKAHLGRNVGKYGAGAGLVGGVGVNKHVLGNKYDSGNMNAVKDTAFSDGAAAAMREYSPNYGMGWWEKILAFFGLGNGNATTPIAHRHSAVKSLLEGYNKPTKKPAAPAPAPVVAAKKPEAPAPAAPAKAPAQNTPAPVETPTPAKTPNV